MEEARHTGLEEVVYSVRTSETKTKNRGATKDNAPRAQEHRHTQEASEFMRPLMSSFLGQSRETKQNLD